MYQDCYTRCQISSRSDRYQADIDKIYLYAKDLYEAKSQLLINKCEDADINYFNDSKVIIEY